MASCPITPRRTQIAPKERDRTRRDVHVRAARGVRRSARSGNHLRAQRPTVRSNGALFERERRLPVSTTHTKKSPTVCARRPSRSREAPRSRRRRGMRARIFPEGSLMRINSYIALIGTLLLGACTSSLPDAGADTGVGTTTCSDTCAYARDGECDDGAPGARTSLCALGSDCSDCGPRGAVTPTPDAMPACIASGSPCRYSADCCDSLRCLVPVGGSIITDSPVCRTCLGSGGDCGDATQCCSSICRQGQCD